MTDTTTQTLAEWLLARIAEDEAAARAALRDEVTGPPHTVLRVDDGRWTRGQYAMDECRIEGVNMIIYDEGGHTPEQAEHIARHDPARVLAECAAKRRIVEAVRRQVEDDDPYIPLPLDVLRALASIYADAPGFREEWR